MVQSVILPLPAPGPPVQTVPTVDYPPFRNLRVQSSKTCFRIINCCKGIQFSLALSTDEAIENLKSNKYAAIISDMGRKEGPKEGYVLLEKLRDAGDKTPFFIYAGSNAPEHKRMAKEKGAQGSTNRAQELFKMVMNAIGKGP